MNTNRLNEKRPRIMDAKAFEVVVRDLKEPILDAEAEANGSSRDDPNCYGAGYDKGYLSSLTQALRAFTED
jgi:hypothetical protein